MSQKPSGLKPPSRLARPSGLPHAKPGGPAAKAQGPSPDAVEHSVLEDFKIGDRVWVSGTKPGRIAYIGETQFAPGEWAGVVLEEPVGKNDGSVAGVRYFQCEQKRGVFSRVTKLYRGPLQPGESAMNTSTLSTLDTSVIPQTPAKAAVTSYNGSVDKGDVTSISAVAPTGAGTRLVTSTPARPSGLARKTSLTSSQTNLNQAHEAQGAAPPVTSHADSGTRHNFKVGDRVLVSGSKQGILRYIGTTDFAPGDWAGVELDEPQGKNDGAVAGKRYFDCRPLYGIFAKTNKVTKLAGSHLPTTTPMRRPSAGRYGLSSAHRERSGSQDSISSIGSSVSTSSRSRVRLGVTSLNEKQAKASSRPKALSLSAENASLQKALKEKVEHIDQLLQERDLERSELARTSAQAENAESALASFRTEHERLGAEKEEAVAQLQQLLEKVQLLEGSNKDLKLRLDEEKRKVEDLQFSVEEATILHDEQEALTTEGAEAVTKLKDLEEKLKKEKERAETLETKLANAKAQYQDYKAKAKDAEDTSVAYLDQIEELTHKLTMAESKIKTLSEDKQTSGAKTNEFAVLLSEKDDRIAHLESAQLETNNQVKYLTNKLKETEEELTESIKLREKQQDTIDEMMRKVASSDTASSNLSGEINQLKSQLTELQRQLDSSTVRSHQLESDKAKLENQITELMQNSGDSSKQLSLMNEELMEKERRLQECKTALCDSTREVGKLRQELEEQRSENERQAEILVSKHQEDLTSAQNNLEEKQSELEKLQSKLEKLKTTHDEDRKELQKQKETEVSELRRVIEKKEEQLQRVLEENEKSRALTESSSEESKQLQFVKEKLEKNVKKLESDKEALSFERDEAATERDILAEENKELQEKHETATRQVAALTAEKEGVEAERKQLIKERDELKLASERLGKEKESLQKAQGSTSSSLHEKDAQILDLTEQIEILKTEAECDKEAYEKQQHAIQAQIASLKEKVQHFEAQAGETQVLQGRLQVVETEREALKLQVNKLKAKEDEKQAMEKQQESLNKQINDLRTSSTAMKEEFAVERKTLQNSLDTVKNQLEQKSTLLDQLKTEMAQLEGENLTIKSLKTTIQGLEIDKNNLQQQVKEMEAAIKDMSNVNASPTIVSTDAAVVKLQEEKQTAEGQVEFLNSVIIDLQQKNSELGQRLAAMENGGFLNGANDSFEINDNIGKKAAPRLFCDICDVFDVHDTEDCPTQAMGDDGPVETQYHGSRGEQRPFCDICEIFGHATEECDDEQTF